MLPASNRGAGQNLAFPDVCNTPVGPATVPIPYPNIAMNAQATAFSMVVKVSMMNALNMSSVIPMTNGDQAGVAHPTVMGAARYTMGNPIVFVDKQPAICLLCPTTGNNMNAPLGAVLVPSAVNVFYTFAADSAEATWLTDVRQRLETLRQASVTAAVAGDVLLLRVAAFPAEASSPPPSTSPRTSCRTDRWWRGSSTPTGTRRTFGRHERRASTCPSRCSWITTRLQRPKCSPLRCETPAGECSLGSRLGAR
jgi:carboxyl-terminal processing protease